MKIHQIQAPVQVMGIALRTTNARAFNDIPAHWQRWTSEGWLARIPGRVGDDLYAVYTHFEHEGIDNLGAYTLIIGVPVDKPGAVPEGLSSAVIPAARYAVFEVERGRHDRVGERWQDVWAAQDLDKAYRCDHEHYRSNGEIEIRVGLR